MALRVSLVVIDANVRGARILRRFLGHGSARVIIFLPENRIGRRDDEAQPAAFH